MRSILDWLGAAGMEADELTVHAPGLEDVLSALLCGTHGPHSTRRKPPLCTSLAARPRRYAATCSTSGATSMTHDLLFTLPHNRDPML